MLSHFTGRFSPRKCGCTKTPGLTVMSPLVFSGYATGNMKQNLMKMKIMPQNFIHFFFRAVLILCLFNCFTLVSRFYSYFPPLWRLSWVPPYSWLQCETSMKKKIFSFSGWKCLEIASSVKCLECKTRLRHISIIYVLDGQNVNKQTLHISHVPFRRLCLAVPLLL